MIKGPSNQKKYAEHWSGDPAFIQPPEPPIDREDAAAKAEHEKAIKEYVEAVERARETGDWTHLRVNGGPSPTTFLMRPMPGEAMRAIVGKLEAGAPPVKVTPLAFRACIEKIENGGYDKEIKRYEEPSEGAGPIASVHVTNYLDSISLAIVNELGSVLIQRGTQGFSPKS